MENILFLGLFQVFEGPILAKLSEKGQSLTLKCLKQA